MSDHVALGVAALLLEGSDQEMALKIVEAVYAAAGKEVNRATIIVACAGILGGILAACENDANRAATRAGLLEVLEACTAGSREALDRQRKAEQAGEPNATAR